jgi:hypothetical protein
MNGRTCRVRPVGPAQNGRFETAAGVRLGRQELLPSTSPPFRETETVTSGTPTVSFGSFVHMLIRPPINMRGLPPQAPLTVVIVALSLPSLFGAVEVGIDGVYEQTPIVSAEAESSRGGSEFLARVQQTPADRDEGIAAYAVAVVAISAGAKPIVLFLFLFSTLRCADFTAARYESVRYESVSTG